MNVSFVLSSCLILMDAFVRSYVCAYHLQYYRTETVRQCQAYVQHSSHKRDTCIQMCIIDMMKCQKLWQHRFEVDSTNLSSCDLAGRPGRQLAAAHQPVATSCDCRFRGTSLYHGLLFSSHDGWPFAWHQEVSRVVIECFISSGS